MNICKETRGNDEHVWVERPEYANIVQCCYCGEAALIAGTWKVRRGAVKQQNGDQINVDLSLRWNALTDEQRSKMSETIHEQVTLLNK